MAKNFKTSATSEGVRFSGTCTVTGETYVVDMEPGQYWNWRNGMLIQDACPNMTADQREFVISKLTPAEFGELFPEDE